METYKLHQWCATVGGKQHAVFTPISCDAETAMAIAVATFGAGVTRLEDEGFVREKLDAAQLHVADSQTCELCGAYKQHDEGCKNAPVDKAAA